MNGQDIDNNILVVSKFPSLTLLKSLREVKTEAAQNLMTEIIQMEEKLISLIENNRTDTNGVIIDIALKYAPLIARYAP